MLKDKKYFCPLCSRTNCISLIAYGEASLKTPLKNGKFPEKDQELLPHLKVENLEEDEEGNLIEKYPILAKYSSSSGNTTITVFSGSEIFIHCTKCKRVTRIS